MLLLPVPQEEEVARGEHFAARVCLFIYHSAYRERRQERESHQGLLLLDDGD